MFGVRVGRGPTGNTELHFWLPTVWGAGCIFLSDAVIARCSDHCEGMHWATLPAWASADVSVNQVDKFKDECGVLYIQPLPSYSSFWHQAHPWKAYLLTPVFRYQKLSGSQREVNCILNGWNMRVIRNSNNFSATRSESPKIFHNQWWEDDMVKEEAHQVTPSFYLLPHRGMLSSGGLVGLILHLGMTSLSRNPPLAQVLRASQSSLLQEHVADMCHRLDLYHQNCQ